MKKLLLFLLFLAIIADLLAQQRTTPLYIDGNGVWRRTSNDQEVAYCGVNYTLPFAHPYRAAGYLGVDRKKAICQDVYQMARLGFNAFRLHLWDVEISDSLGNLIQNDHLDLLDYLIAQLEKRGIDIIITAQTNFGNGYPERNQPTPGYSYLYDKCQIHSNPKAIEAQKNYISQLVRHMNPYTRHTYSSDTCIVALEINNEPCHAVSVDDTRNYINTMVQTVRNSGFRQTILYNMSHNYYCAEAYLSAEGIDGGTFQWYPLGLVSGHRQSFNFLPYVDSYPNYLSADPRFQQKCKVIYEFDPGDITDTYLYPAIMRTFRTAGFQWVTQFAYDPTFLAAYNTDYQTHYLNLLYTPGKAVGMKIAAEVMRNQPLYAPVPSYPYDTVFCNTTVSYRSNLAVYNTPRKYFFTNNTDIQPVDAASLAEICGVGSSPVTRISCGNTPYFLDRISDGVWRLELYPSCEEVSDPFRKPSLNSKCRVLLPSDPQNPVQLSVMLPNLGVGYSVLGISDGAGYSVTDSVTCAYNPGVYLLGRRGVDCARFRKHTYNNIKVNEYYPADTRLDTCYVIYKPKPVTKKGESFCLNPISIIRGGNTQALDSVFIYPSSVSFWNSKNPIITARGSLHNGYYIYNAVIPDSMLLGGEFRYQVVAKIDGQWITLPSYRRGNPLDWDFSDDEYYSVRVVAPNDPITLIWSAFSDKNLIVRNPEKWNGTRTMPKRNSPHSMDCLQIWHSNSQGDSSRTVIYKEIRDIMHCRKFSLSSMSQLCVKFSPMTADVRLNIGFYDARGFTFMTRVDIKKGEDLVAIDLQELTQQPTYFLTDCYPGFLPHWHICDKQNSFILSELEVFQIVTESTSTPVAFGLIGAWLE